MSASRHFFACRLLAHPKLKPFGIRPTRENVTAILAVATHEAGRTPPQKFARFNPLATTWRTGVGPVTDFNTHGVKNYSTLANGLLATAKTLAMDRVDYDRIRDAMAQGESAERILWFWHHSAWGTKFASTSLGTTPEQVKAGCLRAARSVEENWAAVALKEIAS